MIEGALPVLRFQQAQQAHPPVMQRVEQGQRNLQRRGLDVGCGGPAIFLVGLDDGSIFGQREFEADVGVHVALGNVVGDLAHRPTAITVRSFDLRRREAVHRGPQGGGSLLDVVDQFRSLFLVRRASEGKFSDGVTWVAHLGLHYMYRKPENLQESNGERRSGRKFKDKCCSRAYWWERGLLLREQ